MPAKSTLSWYSIRYKKGWSTVNFFGGGGLENDDIGTAIKPVKFKKYVSSAVLFGASM